MDTDWHDIISEFNNVIDETIDTLLEVEYIINEHDAITPVTPHNMYDITEDVAEFGRIRRAEKSLAWRHKTSHM